MGSTVGVQGEDCGPWIHGMIKRLRAEDHEGRSYRIRVTTTGMLSQEQRDI